MTYGTLTLLLAAEVLIFMRIIEAFRRRQE
jgi:hypothetical protein